MSRNSSRLNITAVIGIVVVVLAAILMGAVIVASKPSTQVVYVPKTDIPAFRTLSIDNDLAQKEVTKDGVFANALTPAAVEEMTKDGKDIYTIAPLVKDIPVFRSQVETDPVKALQIVSADEQVVGVTTSSAGSVAGTLRAGDVVDVVTDSNGGSQVYPFAKVIGFGTIKDAGRGVAGVEKPVEGSDDGDLQVILAVAKADAPSVAGQEVSLTKRPYCQVDAAGQITAVDAALADACDIPAERIAAGATK